MLRFSYLFGNNAILQSNKDVYVHGACDADSVKLLLKDVNGTTLFSAEERTNNGRFEIGIGNYDAGGPYTLTAISGNESISSENIFFGEVWIAGGQSNMEFELRNSKDFDEVLEERLYSNISYLNVPRIAYLGEELERAETESCWKPCDEYNVGYMTAVGYYFAQALSEVEPDIKIGIISCNWGGTSASCWIGEEYLNKKPETKVYLDAYKEVAGNKSLEDNKKEWDEYLIYQAAFDEKVGNYYATNSNPTWEEAISLFGENRYPGPMGPVNPTRPCGLFESMLLRLLPLSVAGVLWYQGEEDDNRPYNYYELLKTLVAQWRVSFNDENLPFIIAQLPIFVNEGEDDYMNWPFIREAQARVCKEDENCHLAVILENGEYHNIHPVNKESVGYRMAFQALHKVYGAITLWEANGPEYDSCFTENEYMYVDILCCDQGLMLNGDDNFIEDIRMQDYLPVDSGFELAGEDKIYYPAKAQVLRGEDPGIITLKLHSDKVKQPAFARYFWKNYGKVRIFGGNGIPLAPFRTSMKDEAMAKGSRQGELL